MNAEELKALNDVKDELKKFRRRYMFLWGGIFATAFILRLFGLW